MTHALKVIIVCGFCHYIAYFILAKLTPFRDQLKQYFIVSVLVIAVAVLARSVMLAYLVLLISCFHFLKGKDPSTRIAFFFGMAFTLSLSAGLYLDIGVPIGGISHYKVLIIGALVPVLLFARKDPAIWRLNVIDWYTMLFFVWIALLGSRGLSITAIARQDMWLIIELVVPYLVIRRYTNNYLLVLTAISYALLSQAAIGFCEAILTWHVHTDIERAANFFQQVNPQYKFRGPFLRAQASFMNPLIYALFANMSFLCSLLFLMRIGLQDTEKYSRWIAWAGLALAAMGALASVSRAGIAGVFLLVIVALVLIWAIKKPRDPKGKLIGYAVVAIVAVILFGGDFISEHFGYRVRLFEVSMEVIKSQPMFGHPDVRSDPRMQVLHLGEGIIDIVNAYLEFALTYGIPAVLLFVFVLFTSMSRLYDNLRHAKDEKLIFGVFAFSCLFILAFNLMTTSAFGWTYIWVWLLIAISSNIVERVSYDRKHKTPKAPNPNFF